MMRPLAKLSIITLALTTIGSVPAHTRLIEDEALKEISSYRTWLRVNDQLQAIPDSSVFG